MESGLSDQELLTLSIQRFEEADEARMTAANLAERCRDYYDGKQLTSAEQAELARRKQPPVVINRIRRKIDWLRGLEMQSRTDPKAYPRTPQHEQGAQAATDAIRYVCDYTDFDRKRSAAWENILIEGIGAVEIIHEAKGEGREPEICINHYSFDRIFADPYSRAADYSDARYLGAVIWQDMDALAMQYPASKAEIEASISVGTSIGTSYEDTPRWKMWGDKARQRVRLVLMHYLDGTTWKWIKYVHGGILEHGESLYVDEYGLSVCPMLLQSAYIDRDGARYGVVKDMLDPQDEINKRRSKLLHQLNSRQTMGIKGAVSVEKLKAELAKPDGHVEIDPAIMDAAREMGMAPFELLQQNDQIAGQFSLLQHATSEIDLMGANSGLAGKDGSGGQSGRAIMARQQGGLIEIAPLTDGLSDFTRRCYRHIWMRVRQFWKAEKWIRVTDDERNVRFVGLNRPVTLRQKLESMPEDQARMIVQQMGLVPNDPRLSMVAEIQNPVEEIDIDIVLEEVPDAVTLEAETFQQVVNIATSMPGSVPPQILIEMAPGLKRDVKDKLLKNLEEQVAAQQQQPQNPMIAIEAEKTQAETQHKLSLAQKTNVEAQRLALGY
jgi:hypothetical protein